MFAKRLFGSRRAKDTKNVRKQGSKSKGGSPSPANTMAAKLASAGPSQAAIAQLMLSKMPVPEDLTTMLNTIVYVKPFSEVNKDILRLIRRVSVVQRSPGQEENTITPSSEELPKEVAESEKEGVYLVMILMTTLVHFFEEESTANEMEERMKELYAGWVRKTKAEAAAEAETSDAKTASENETEKEEAKEKEKEELVEEDRFTVLDLIKAIGGDKTKTALALRCIHQSVAISGHTHIKSKVCPFMTKDVRGNSGWQVTITLAEYVQVKHTRRECSIESSRDSRNHWEMEFDVHLTFDKNMTEITATKLTVTDLHLSETMDTELEKYLKDKFQNGSLVVC